MQAHIANSDIKTNEVRRDTAATVEDTQGNDTASAQTNQLRRAAAADTSVPAEAGAPKEKQPKEPKTKGSKTKESETKEPKDIDEKKLKTRSVGGKGGAAKSGNGGEADGGNSNSSIKDSLIGVNALNFGSNNG